MKKIISILLALTFICAILSSCGGAEAANNAGIAADSGSDAGSKKIAASENPGMQTYDNVKTIDIPAAFPADKFPISKSGEDKIIKINDFSDGSSFDIKAISIRPAKEIVEEYAKLWKLENENTIYLDELGSATLSGTRDGYEIIVNGSEQSPELLEGSKTYLAILVKKSAK